MLKTFDLIIAHWQVHPHLWSDSAEAQGNVCQLLIIDLTPVCGGELKSESSVYISVAILRPGHNLGECKIGIDTKTNRGNLKASLYLISHNLVRCTFNHRKKNFENDFLLHGHLSGHKIEHTHFFHLNPIAHHDMCIDGGE